jgi:hypothetical protein
VDGVVQGKPNGDQSWDAYRRYVVSRIDDNARDIERNRHMIEGIRGRFDTMERRVIGWLGGISAFTALVTILANFAKIVSVVRGIGG